MTKWYLIFVLSLLSLSSVTLAGPGGGVGGGIVPFSRMMNSDVSTIRIEANRVRSVMTAKGEIVSGEELLVRYAARSNAHLLTLKSGIVLDVEFVDGQIVDALDFNERP